MGRFLSQIANGGRSLIGIASGVGDVPIGSNGFFQRQQFLRPGGYTFTAPSDGDYLIQALGAGSGADLTGGFAGGSGGFSEKLISLVAGDEVLITTGEGGWSERSSGDPSGGTTTIACAARGLSMTLVGAKNNNTGPVRSAGTATGGDINFDGALPKSGNALGGASSASYFATGFQSTNRGGSGWGGSADGYSGSSSHLPSPNASSFGVNGLRFKAMPGLGNTNYQLDPSPMVSALSFWDVRDVDGASGAVSAVFAGDGAGGSSNLPSFARGGDGGFGGGGAGGTTTGGSSPFGGGAGFGSNHGDSVLRRGGHGFVQIFWEKS